MADPSATTQFGPVVNMALGLLLVLGVILVAFWMLKRFGPKLGLGRSGAAHGLAFVGQMPLGPRKSLVVVRFLNKVLVLGVTDQSINLITEVDQPDEGRDDFAQALAAARGASGVSPGRSGDPGPGPGRPDNP